MVVEEEEAVGGGGGRGRLLHSYCKEVRRGEREGERGGSLKI